MTEALKSHKLETISATSRSTLSQGCCYRSSLVTRWRFGRIRMATSFELMDLDSGNLVGSYHTLEEALQVVRDAYAAYGQSGVDDLGLGRVESGGSQECIAIGSELVEYALGSSLTTQ